MKAVKIFDLLVWPLILIGLIRGLFLTYKCFKETCHNRKKEQQLQYWVVLSSMMLCLPWFSKILGWFVFSGTVGMIKLGLITMVVLTRDKHCAIYSLLEKDLFLSAEPWIRNLLKFGEAYRKQFCDFAILSSTTIHQWLIYLLINEVSRENFESLTANMNTTLNIIERAEVERQHKLTSK